MREIAFIVVMATVLFVAGLQITVHTDTPNYLPSLESKGRYEHITIGNKINEIRAIYKVKSDDIMQWPVILTIRAKGNYGIRRNHNYYEVWVENHKNILFKTDWTLIKID